MTDTLEVLFKGHIDQITFIVPDADKALAEIEVAIDDGMRTVALVDTHGDTILLVCSELQCCFVGETDTDLEQSQELPEDEVNPVIAAWADKFSNVEAYLPAEYEAKTSWRERDNE